MAVKVPLMSTEITPQATPEIAPAPMLRPPEEAFGGESAAARERQGGAIVQSGDVVFQRMMEHRQREMDQQNLDIMTQAHQSIQNLLNDPTLDENQTPKGFLQRQMNQAKGATSAYDQQAIQLKKRIMQMPLSPLQRQDLNRSLSTSLLAGREAVVAHESQQTQAAFDNSFQENMKQTVGNAAVIYDPAMLGKYIDAAQASAGSGWKHAGLEGVSVEQAKQGYAGEITKSALTSVLEANPKQAQALLDGVKDRLSPEQAATMQQQITGKMTYDTIQNVTDWAKNNARMPDGTIDRSKIDSYIDSLHLQPQIAYEVKTHADRLAMVDYSEMMKKRQDAERSFTNELIAAQSKGIPYDQALKIPAKYGWDNTSIANMQDEVTKIYASPQEKFNTWISRQPQETQGAWSEVQNIVKAKYGNTTGNVAGVKQKLADAALTELKQDVIGKNPDQIREIAKQKLANVTVGPGAIWGNIWPNKEEGWKIDTETRTGISEANTQLEKDYGVDRVGQARTYLVENNIPVTPNNIKAALDKALEGKK